MAATDPVQRELPPHRWAVPFALVGGALWLVTALVAVRWIVGQERQLGRQLAARGGVLVVMALAAALVVVIVLARSLADSVLTFTDESLRCHAGERRTTRWSRIKAIEPGRLGRHVTLDLHGGTRPEQVAGTQWLTAAQRARLVTELEARRARARRLERRPR